MPRRGHHQCARSCGRPSPRPSIREHLEALQGVDYLRVGRRRAPGHAVLHVLHCAPGASGSASLAHRG
eukprot:6596151-Lingulodinium_polyedra.AAC.1